VFWTAFVGLFFDYYDLYLFVYLEKVLAMDFGLTVGASNALQFVGMAGVGLGALIFGWLADRYGRGPIMLVVFGAYVLGVAGISVAWNFESLLGFRLLASLALGAEWGISHAFMSEHVGHERRYRFAAFLQFAILGGLLAALMTRFALPFVGWRWLFALSLLPVMILSAVRWRVLATSQVGVFDPAARRSDPKQNPADSVAGWMRPFLQCFGIASLTIASGMVNVFFAKELPQSPFYTVLFWANVAPGMLVGAWIVRRMGVRRALVSYAFGLISLSVFAWASHWEGRKLAFALVLPLLNGIPFGLMGAYFNEVFAAYRTTLSGSAYNLGRILAGFAPVLITALGLHAGGNYFLFTAALGLGVLAIGWTIHEQGVVSPRGLR